MDSSRNLIPIYGPTTGKPFPQHKIPQQRFSALAQSLPSETPDPDTAGVNGGLVSNKLPAIHSIPLRQTLWDYTIDETFTTSQSIHFSQWHDSANSPFFTSAPIVRASNQLQSEVTNENTGKGLVLNYAKTITLNLVVTAGADAIGNIIGQHNANNNVSFDVKIKFFYYLVSGPAQLMSESLSVVLRRSSAMIAKSTYIDGYELRRVISLGQENTLPWRFQSESDFKEKILRILA